MAANLSAAEARARDPVFVQDCSLQGLRERLPLRWPTPPNVPPSPKRAYRSHYVYPAPDSLPDSADPTGRIGQAGHLPGWEELLDPAAWEHPPQALTTCVPF